MKRSTARWTTAVAAAALCVLPATGRAQTTSTAQQPPSSGTPGQYESQRPAAAQPTPQAGAAQEHLQQATQALNDIQPSSVSGQSRAQLAQLKRHMSALERSMATENTGSTAGATERSTRTRRGARTTAASNWQTEVAAIDRILTNMLGSKTASATGTDEPSTAGTTGSTATGRTRAGAKSSSSATLDAATRTKLEEVRTHITAFAAAMSGTAAQAPQNETAQSQASTSATGTTGTSGTMSSAPASPPTTAQEPSTTAGAQAGTTATQPGATAAAGGQVDQTAAKSHLTEARNSLSEITQLPAAAQLTGAARTQVSQLISNFNELITTNADWRAAYAKVNANLTALLGPDGSESTTSSTAGATTATGTTGTQPTTATAGVPNLDPAIRAKLVEFRTHLQEFERAASGSSTAPSAAAPSTPSESATAPATTSPAATAPSATTPSATAGQYPTGTSGSQPGQAATASGVQPKSEAMGPGEALRHIEAIENIMSGSSGASATGATGTAGSTAPSGNVTLERGQIEQIRMHLNELKRIVGQAKDENK